MTVDAAVEGALRRDRWIVLAMLFAVFAASWAYVLSGAGMGMSAIEMTRMDGMAGTDDMGAADEMGGMSEMEGMSETGGMAEMAMTPMAWSPGHAVMMFFMWWIMMVAMMLPGATPMILLFAAVQRRQRAQGNPYVPTTLFTASYLLAWAGFSLAATAAHWGLERGGLIGPHMVLTSQLIGAGLLLAAGLYQLTPIKQACLKHCRFPVAWLAEHWRPGRGGAMVLGLHHGAYCLGCCWVLMLLLFFGGVMNLYWIAGLAVYVLVEKTIPAGHWLDYGLSGLLVLAGGLLLGLAVL